MICRRYVVDFGRVRLAVLECEAGEQSLKTTTRIIKRTVSERTWKKLERVMARARNWVEAQ